MNDDEMTTPCKHVRRPPWNKGKLIGAKPPLRQGHVWSIRTRLQLERRTRDLALFNLAIDSKLRGCDVVAVRVDDVAPNGYAIDRATVRQKKTGRPAQCGSNSPNKPGRQLTSTCGLPADAPGNFCSLVGAAPTAA